MLEYYYVGAYWGNREETASECARRAAALIRSLSGCDQALARWFRRGRSRDEALRREVAPSQEALQALFERGRNRRDADRAVIEDLGFRIGIWNGATGDDAVGLDLKCGSYASTARVWIPNSCVIDLPGQGPTSERLARTETLTCVLEAIVRAVEPDFAVANSSTLRDLLRAAPGVPQVGWLTYLSARYGHLPPLPSASRVVPVDALGSLVITTDERFTATNPEHVAAAESISRDLDRAGLLRRLD